MAFHENEGTIRGKARFALLMNKPALILRIFNLAVVSTDGFKFKLNITLVRSANVEAILLVTCFKKDFVLDHIAVLISRHPSRAGSENSFIVNLVVMLRASHYNEALIALRRGLDLMSELVNMIVHDFAEIDKRPLVKLKGCLAGNLQAGGVYDTKITNVEAAIFADDHELRLPEFLVVCDNIVVAVTLSYLVLSGVAIEADFEILKFFSIDRTELES